MFENMYIFFGVIYFNLKCILNPIQACIETGALPCLICQYQSYKITTVSGSRCQEKGDISNLF